MNNEEKILQLLSQMHNDINKRFDKLETKVDKLETQFDKLEHEVNQLSIVTEDIQHNVEILAEGHSAIIERLDNLPDFNKVEIDIEAIKTAISDHSEKFNKLKAL